MGATDTHAITPRAHHTTLRAAFRSVQEADQYEHGHSGTTGTIGSATGCISFPPSGADLGPLPLKVVTAALTAPADSPELNAARQALQRTLPEAAAHLDSARAAWDDKWGPAVGFTHGTDYHFMSIVPE